MKSIKVKAAILCVTCATVPLLFIGCADREKIRQLEQDNADLRTQVQSMRIKLDAAAEERKRLTELEQAHRLLLTELERLKNDRWATQTVAEASAKLPKTDKTATATKSATKTSAKKTSSKKKTAH